MISKGMMIGCRLWRIDDLKDDIWEQDKENLHRICRETEHLNTSLKLIRYAGAVRIIALEAEPPMIKISQYINSLNVSLFLGLWDNNPLYSDLFWRVLAENRRAIDNLCDEYKNK